MLHVSMTICAKVKWTHETWIKRVFVFIIPSCSAWLEARLLLLFLPFQAYSGRIQVAAGSCRWAWFPQWMDMRSMMMQRARFVSSFKTSSCRWYSYWYFHHYYLGRESSSLLRSFQWVLSSLLFSVPSWFPSFRLHPKPLFIVSCVVKS